MNLGFALAAEGLVDEAVAVDGCEEVGLGESAGVKLCDGLMPARWVAGQRWKGVRCPELSDLREGVETVGEVGGVLD